jgi:hypothetical protein
MRVIRDGLWLCSDCTQVAIDGPHGADITTDQLQRTLDGLSMLGEHLVSDNDSETGNGIEEFSRNVCKSCQTRLLGYRARFATLGN